MALRISTFALLAAITLFHPQAWAGSLVPLPVVGVTCTEAYNIDYPCAAVIDGVVNDTLGASPHSYWLGGNGAVNDIITLDMGGVYQLDSITLYNTHNGYFGSNDRGTQGFEMWISSTPGSPFGTLLASGTLAWDTSNPNPPYLINLSSPAFGEYVTFEETSYYNAGPGLSEIELEGETPEPSTLLLVAGAALVLWRRRREA